jgi:nitrite reductase/ring-hydroxylating ferredoxin subunit
MTARFHPLEQVGRLHDGYLKAFEIDGVDVVLVQQAGQPSVLEGICPHAGHPFRDSRVRGTNIRCDMHGYLFDLQSGACTYYTEGPCRALRVYPWEVRDGCLGVLL